jgi:hypothetical protein
MSRLSRPSSTGARALPAAAWHAALALAVLLLAAAAPSAAARGWLRPVSGEAVRAFDYTPRHAFAGGAHRGVDFAAATGTRVRSACTGHVVHAGTVAALGGVVTVRCGDRRVTYMPLAAIAVREGARVVRGAGLGMVAAGHGGLHLGVRRAGDRFAYEDPLAHFGGGTPPLLVGLRPHGSARPSTAVPAQPTAPGRTAVSARPASTRQAPAAAWPPSNGATEVPVHPPAGGARPGALVRAPRASPAVPRPRPASTHRGTAPWPVWVGLAALLTGCVGTGSVALGRRRRAAPAPVSAQSS